MINSYIQVVDAAPILNTPDFKSVFGGSDRTTLMQDERGHVRAFEFVALPGSFLKVVQDTPDPCILKVSADFYSSQNLYIDKRFTRKVLGQPKNQFQLPASAEIQYQLRKSLGVQYVWGGNYQKGCFAINHYYPRPQNLSSSVARTWLLQGVDCSGLLYEATNGHLPRNTSDLAHFGQAVPAANKSITDIIKLLQPLDLIIHPGHVIIVLDLHYIIESKETAGVVKTEIRERLNQLLTERQAVDSTSEMKKDKFIIRRWASN